MSESRHRAGAISAFTRVFGALCADAVQSQTVMPRHSRPKDGVASLAYGRGIQNSLQAVLKLGLESIQLSATIPNERTP